MVQVCNLPNEIQSMVDSVMKEYGPQLGHALIFSIGGEAARSELDFLAEPLKKLVSSQPRAKMWLMDALSSDAFPSQKVTDVEKRVWLQKIIRYVYQQDIMFKPRADAMLSLRGASKGTNQVIKEFWMACRGTNLSYAS